MIIPNPARLVIISRELDDVSGLVDEKVQELYVRNVADLGDGRIRWSNRTTQLYGLVDQGDRVTGINQDTTDTIDDVAPAWTYTFHQVTTYDAVRLAPQAGVPQPLIVVRADIQEGGSMLAQELDAVVAADNTVVTLMLDTGLGVFVRFGHDWQLLESDSQTLEDLGIVQVGPGALDAYDAAQAAGVTLSVFELPTVTQDDDRDIVDPDELPSLAERQAVTASIPVIASAADLDLGIRFGQTHPGARWYVTKRAHALSAGHLLPPEWVGEQVSAVTAGGLRLDNQAAVLTAAELYRNLHPDADPDDDFYRAIVAAARRQDLLQSPDVVRAMRAHTARRRPVLAAVGASSDPAAGPSDAPDRQALRDRVHGAIATLAAGHDADDDADPLVAGSLGKVFRKGRGAFQEWQHPRGSDGKFVNKGGSVNVTPSGGGSPRRGKISRLTEAGPQVRYEDGSSEVVPLGDVGTRVSKAPTQRARLDQPGGNDLNQLSDIMRGNQAQPPPAAPTGAPPTPAPTPHAPDDPPEVPPPPSEPADLNGLSDKARAKVENLKVREIPQGFELYYDEATDDVLAKDRHGTVWVVDDAGYYGTQLDPRHRRDIDEQTMVNVTDHVKPLGKQIIDPESGGSVFDVPPKQETVGDLRNDVGPSTDWSPIGSNLPDHIKEALGWNNRGGNKGSDTVLAPNKPATPDQIDPQAPDNAPAIKDEELSGALEEGVVDPHLNEMKADGNVSPTPARKVKASELVANGVVVSQANQDKIDKMPELNEGDRIVVNPVNDDLYVQDKDGALRRVDDDGQLSEPFVPPPVPAPRTKKTKQQQAELDRQAQPAQPPGEGQPSPAQPPGGQGQPSPARQAARQRVNQSRRSGGGGGRGGQPQQPQNVPPPGTWALIKELLFRVLTLNLRKRAPVGTPAPAPAPAPVAPPGPAAAASGVLVTSGAPPLEEALFE